MLSYDYWKTRFAASRDIVGQTVLINGHPFTILGVAPAELRLGHRRIQAGRLYPHQHGRYRHALDGPRDNLDNHQSVWLTLVARLKPGVTIPQAEASLGPLWHSLRAYEFTLYKGKSERFRREFVDNSHLKVHDDSTGFNPDRMDLKSRSSFS